MKFLQALAALLFCVSVAHAHEAIFSWTYTTDLTPKGHGEFEQWFTTRWEKEHGSYSVVDFREEFEYGVTDNFQLALYLNHHYVYANDDIPVTDPAHPKLAVKMCTPDMIRQRRSTVIILNRSRSKGFIDF